MAHNGVCIGGILGQFSQPMTSIPAVISIVVAVLIFDHEFSGNSTAL